MRIATKSTAIRQTPNVCGGEACVGHRRITVWMLVNARRLGLTDEQLLERYDPPLEAEELQAAWDYYRIHHDEIDDAIRRNNEV